MKKESQLSQHLAAIENEILSLGKIPS